MSEGTEPLLQIVLADEVISGQIRVSLDNFIEFCAGMEEELAELERRWQHLSAPNANALRRSNLP